MLISEDDLKDTVVPRLMAAGADLSRVFFAMRTIVPEDATKKERRIALDTDMAAVEAAIVKHSCVLAILDPLTSYLGKLQKNKDEDMRRVLNNVADLAERTSSAVISIGHFNKDGSQAGIQRLSGAGALNEVPRAAWAFVREPEEEQEDENTPPPPRDRIMMNAKLNVTSEAKKSGIKYNFESVTLTFKGGKQDEVGKIKWGGEWTGANLDGLLQGGAKPRGREPEKTTGAMDWLKDHLPTGEWMICRVIYEEAEKEGHNVRTVKEAANRLGVKFDHPGGKGPWYMQLPKTTIGHPPNTL